MDDLDSIVDKLVEAQYGKESPVQIANIHERIAELEQRIEKAKALVGHKSLDSRRELLEILEGTENNP